MDVSSVPQAYREHAEELSEQLDFIKAKLEKVRTEMADVPIVYTAKSTQGEIIPKRNPLFDEYNALMRTYNSTIASLRELMGSDSAELPQRGKLLKFEKKYGKTG